jgi:hypothetical protein
LFFVFLVLRENDNKASAICIKNQENRPSTRGDRRHCNASPLFVNCYIFVPNGPHECNFFTRPK